MRILICLFNFVLASVSSQAAINTTSCISALGSFNNEDLGVIQKYQEGDFALYNSFLRTGKVPYRWRTREKSRDKVNLLASALEKIPPVEASLNRYIDVGQYKKSVRRENQTLINLKTVEDFIKPIEGSGFYSDSAFMSTTPNDIPSGKFVFTTVQFRLHSRQGRPIAGVATMYPEAEFMFLPGAPFRVKRITGEFVRIWDTNVGYDAYPGVDQWINYVEYFRRYFPGVTPEEIRKKFQGQLVPNVVIELEDL